MKFFNRGKRQTSCYSKKRRKKNIGTRKKKNRRKLRGG